MKKLFVAAFLPLFILAACNFTTADARLDGTWESAGAIVLVFEGASFTRSTPGLEMARGTFVVNSDTITFHRRGVAPEVQNFDLAHPVLTIGETVFHRREPVMPPNLEGLWSVIGWDFGTLGTIRFSAPTPQVGNPRVLEGFYWQYGIAAGRYTIHSMGVPGSTILNVFPQMIHGSSLSFYVQEALPASLQELFDPQVLASPPFDADYWWFTIDEVRTFIGDAASRARNLQEEIHMESFQYWFFNMHMPVSYSFLVGNNPELPYRFQGAAPPSDGLDGRPYGNELSLRAWICTFWECGYVVFEYVRLIEDDMVCPDAPPGLVPLSQIFQQRVIR